MQQRRVKMEVEKQFEFTASEDGNSVILKATKRNEEPVSVSIPVDVVGQIVVGLLGASMACAQMSEQPAFAENDRPEFAFIQATGVAVQDVTDRPDVVALTLLFGQTQVDVGLSREALQPLGAALLAATADRSQLQ
jgi:hypothetical protein